MFDTYTQGDTSTTRRSGGTGLGLAISQHLARAMNGEIRVTSEWGRGSEFTLEVRLQLAPALSDNSAAQASAGAKETAASSVSSAPSSVTGPPSIVPARTASWGAPVAPAGAGPRSGLRVLLVEDNPVNRKVCGAMLQRLDCMVQVACDGAQAVDAASNGDFDVVLMDCQMSVLDGYAATAGIRSLAGERGRVPIFALTADALAEVRERCLAAGIDGFLTKPLSMEALAAALQRVVDSDTASATRE